MQIKTLRVFIHTRGLSEKYNEQNNNEKGAF